MFESRLEEWNDFSDRVDNHISDYTVQQYGDYNEDMASTMSSDACMQQIKRYVMRYGNNARGPIEARRDMLKIAHYACIIFYKLLNEE